MRLFKRLAAAALVMVAVYTAAATAWAECQNDPPVCTAHASKPKMNVLVNPPGYFVNNWGTIVCNRPVKHIHTSLVLLADGAPMRYDENDCYNIDRCPATNLMYVPCGSDGICEQLTWTSAAAGSVTWVGCKGEKRKQAIPRDISVGVVNPAVCYPNLRGHRL